MKAIQIKLFLLSFVLFSFFAMPYITAHNYSEIKGHPFLQKPKPKPKPLKIAICYWGLTRSTSKVYESHYTKIFDLLKDQGHKFDVFMHTWKIKSKQRV